MAAPWVRDSLSRFDSNATPDIHGIVRTRSVEATVVGAYVRGMSDRDIESLARGCRPGIDQQGHGEPSLPRAA